MAAEIEQIKRLKDLTGVGLTDAKKALEEAGGDYQRKRQHEVRADAVHDGRRVSAASPVRIVMVRALMHRLRRA